jgi:hypothetical protein
MAMPSPGVAVSWRHIIGTDFEAKVDTSAIKFQKSPPPHVKELFETYK